MSQKTSDFQIWRPEVKAYIQDEKEKQTFEAHKEFFSVEKSDRLQIPELTYAGLPPMQEVGELGDAIEDSSREGYEYTYNRKVFRQSQVFSGLLWKTDQQDKVETMARDLVRSQKYSRELHTLSMIRRAYDSSLVYGDGVTLVSLSHPRKDGGSAQGNTFADGVQLPLTYDNVLRLQDVQISAVSNSGNIMTAGAPGRNKVLFGSTYLREKLFQIAGVEGADKEPDTDENNVNYIRRGDKFDVLVTDFLGYEAAKQAGETGTITKTSSSNYWDTMWGILDTGLAKRYFKLYEGTSYPKFDDEVVKANESLIYYAYDHYAFGNTAWYPVVVSKGDNSTFSG